MMGGGLRLMVSGGVRGVRAMSSVRASGLCAARASARSALGGARVLHVKPLHVRFSSSSTSWSTPSSTARLTGTKQTSSGAHELPLRRATLTLEDGTKLPCYSFGADKGVSGEIVFSTGMVGYTESLTDPSYTGQMLTLTYPMVGNYGVPDMGHLDEVCQLPVGFESGRIHASALLVQEYSHMYSHWRANQSLGAWLRDQDVVGLSGLDTRMLTKRIRSEGALLGKVTVEGAGEAPPIADPNKRNLVAEASRKTVETFGKGNPYRVVAIDCGMKNNIIRQLVQRGAEVTVVPWDYDINAIDPASYDGLFISNGPGDPTRVPQTIENLRVWQESQKQQAEATGKPVKPLFGICLGNQLTALAAGAKSEKMPFGNRGQNQPVRNELTGEVYITPQNHGYAVDNATLPKGWLPLFTNSNDNSNEGIMHESLPWFTAQFHPEANGGPTDTAFLFDTFLGAVQSYQRGDSPRPVTFPKPSHTATRKQYKKVLILGSGGLSIGQAGEFDFSGGQAIKALKEEGVDVLLINPNIASVQTSVDDKTPAKADQVFFLPVQPEYVEQVIKRERPDGILVSMGGQTALNCAVDLYRDGVLDKYGVDVLGTPIQTVIDTEDRDIFADKLREINEKLAPSIAVTDVEAAVTAAEEIQYPVMVRSAFALGGMGSGICRDETELRTLVNRALSTAPQVLVEKSLLGWKEVEYEVVRDAANNCVTVCNMENFDPLGVHTGDSIVAAPSQTLSNEEYHMLRQTAINVVRHLGIVGECNIQYALDPKSLDYCIIEVNARLSRSSALASKATGYPLAAVAAKLGMGLTLPEIKNAITQRTYSAFEPSLDYVVTKVPRWDLDKFDGVERKIGSAMQAVGEVMSIGRTWEESVQKALRMVDPAVAGFEADVSEEERNKSREELRALLEPSLRQPNDKRMFAIARALHEGVFSVDEIHELTAIDHWFLRRLERISDFKNGKLSDSSGFEAFAGDKQLFREAKQLGFSDVQIASAFQVGEDDVRKARLAHGLRPRVKQIDTLSAEYPAETNYLYTTYHGDEDDVLHARDGGNTEGGVAVLGCGAYRIGSSVEFDSENVSAIRTLRAMGKRSIAINYNPETVSTDYDECDQLYFEELSRERVLDILEHENAEGVIVSVGGQIPNNLALPLYNAGVRVLGTSPIDIDRCEDRDKFSSLVDAAGLQQPAWSMLRNKQDALDFAAKVGYPVLVRPSYVLSGAAMNVAYDAESLSANLDAAGEVSGDHPVVLSKFITGAREVEVDAVAFKGEIITGALHEHVEHAGVHSGDATLVLPPYDLSPFQRSQVVDAARKLARDLNITGPFNTQFITRGSDCMVIETNLRASRSVPFVSKATGSDLIEAATRLMVLQDDPDAAMASIAEMNAKAPLPLLDDFVHPAPNHVLPRKGKLLGTQPKFCAVKAPMFSFPRLRGADPVLGVEMASTGEVACFGSSREEAFLKAMISSGFKLPQRSILISVDAAADADIAPDVVDDLIHSAYVLNSAGFELSATSPSYESLVRKGIKVKHAQLDSNKTGALEAVRSRDIDLVVNIPSLRASSRGKSGSLHDNYTLRRTAVDFGVPLVTNMEVFKLLSEALRQERRGEIVITNPDALFDWYRMEDGEDAWTSDREFH